MPTPHHPRAITTNPDWTRYTPVPIGRDTAGRRQWKAAIADEAEDLARLPCDTCGHIGLGLIARLHRQTGSYRPLAFCPACGDRFEF
jgi:hypothetical protein